MTRDERASRGGFTRRDLLERLALAGAIALSAPVARAQSRDAEPPSTVSTPARDFTPGAQPAPYPDPDVLVLDPAFNALRVFNAPIQRLWTGSLWAEGPAWSSQGTSPTFSSWVTASVQIATFTGVRTFWRA